MGKSKVVVIGGGASGLIAAIIAAQNGAKVTILERKNRLGKKILATGNGRCNLSNLNCSIDKFHGKNKDFVSHSLDEFNVKDTIEFFKEIGIYPLIKDNGKIYPFSEQASSILDVLRYEVERLKIIVECDTNVIKIESGKSFKIHTSTDKTYYGNKVILAAGGKSCPDLGSNGSGFDLAKVLGHTIISPFPSLVQLKSDASYLKQLKGVKFVGMAKILDSNRKSLREEYGEILFTDYGISGPPILQISRIAANLLKEHETPYVQLDMMNEFLEEELDELLINRLSAMPYKLLSDNFIGLLNKRLIPIIIKECGIDINKKSADITKQERKKLVKTIKGLTLTITGTHQWNQSQVTAGGVSTEQINNKTMESLIVPDLYLTGEVVDIDGDCGGYNLQWAWSSGYVAGKQASK